MIGIFSGSVMTSLFAISFILGYIN